MRKKKLYIYGLKDVKYILMNTRYEKKEIIKISKQAEHGKPASGMIIDICIVENSL